MKCKYIQCECVALSWWGNLLAGFAASLIRDIKESKTLVIFDVKWCMSELCKNREQGQDYSKSSVEFGFVLNWIDCYLIREVAVVLMVSKFSQSEIGTWVMVAQLNLFAVWISISSSICQQTNTKYIAAQSDIGTYLVFNRPTQLICSLDFYLYSICISTYKYIIYKSPIWDQH